MKKHMVIGLCICAGLLLSGCSREPGSKTLTRGSLAVDCDEAVFPVVNLLAQEFGFFRQCKMFKTQRRHVKTPEAGWADCTAWKRINTY